MRRMDDYPDYSGFLDYLEANGFDNLIMNKIIDRHAANRRRTTELYERYKCYEDVVPIFLREPRFKDGLLDENGNPVKQLNNRVNNDFFGEINDIMIGYFAGKAAAYSYSTDNDSEDETGGEQAVEEAQKAITDFVNRSNFYDLNQEMTKYASVCGYAGRLFYIDRDGEARCMIVPPYGAIAIARDRVTEPEFAVRYYRNYSIDGAEQWHAEGYDSRNIYYFDGVLGAMALREVKPHMFDFCPMQLVPLNGEMMSAAERVMALIDEYDKAVSDNANDAEGNTQAQQIFDGIELSDEEMAKAKRSGSIQIPPGMAGENHSVYYLTKDINDGFNEHHLDRIERNIYRFSKTPNLNDDTFMSASGIALKFKLTAFEAKCGTFEAKCSSADTYMFKVLGSIFQKQGIAFDYLQAYVEYKRNFPVDVLSEAQSVQSLINAGVPEEIAFNQLSCVDDINYLMELKEEKKQDALDLFGGSDGEDDEDDDGEDEPRGRQRRNPLNEDNES